MKAKEELFSFLQTEYQDLAELAASIERNVYADPHLVLVKARLFGEKFAKLVTKQEDINEVFDVKQVDRIHKLARLQIINDDIRSSLEWLRLQGNKAAHEIEYGTVELSLNAHRILYDLSSWLFEVYGDLEFKAPAYRLPIMERAGNIDKDEISELISQVLKSTLENTLMPSIQNTIRQMQEEVTRSSIASTVMQLESVKETVLEAEEPKRSKVIASKHIKSENFDLIEYLKENTVESIDKRSSGGALWIIGGWELNKVLFPLKEKGIYFKYTPKGSGATKKKPGWFLLGKKAASTENGVNEIKDERQVQQPQIIIPTYLKDTGLEEYASGPVTELTKQFGIQYFKEISDEHLRKIYSDDQQKFYDIITHLWFLGARFTGKLAQLLTLNHEENITTLTTSKPLIGELRDLLPLNMTERFQYYGIYQISQLNHVPITSLQWLMNAHFNEVFAILRPYFYEEMKQVDDPTPVASVKQICFSGECAIITQEKVAIPITYETFRGCNKLVWYLQKNGIVTIGDLPSDLQQFEEIKGIGFNYLSKFFKCLLSIVDNKEIDSTHFEMKESETSESREGYMVGYENRNLLLPNSLLSVALEVKDFLTCPNLVSKLALKGIATYGQLPGNLMEMTRMSSVGKGAVSKFFEHLLIKLERWQEEQQELESIRHLSVDELENHYFEIYANYLDTLITNDSIFQETGIEPRTIEILQERFNSVQNGKRFTLEECGQKYGLTREGIRQIIKKAVIKIALKGERWITVLKGRLEEQKGFIVNQAVKSNNFRDHVIIEALENEGIYLIYGSKVFTTLSRAELGALEKEIGSWLDNKCNGCLLDEPMFKEMLSERSSVTGITSEVLRFMIEPFFIQTVSGHFLLANYKKPDLVTLVMLQYPEGVEIYKNEPELIDKGNQIVPHSFMKERDFYSVVIRDELSEIFYLWGRGTYIHHSFVNPDMTLLGEIAKEIALQLENQRNISVGRVFPIFEEELLDAGIPNEYALYTLLRLHFSTHFTVPKFPKIMRYGDTGSRRNSDLIKDYIREQGMQVSRKQLYTEFVENKGWKMFTLEFNLSSDSEIIQVDHGAYGLIEFYAHIEKSSLMNIVNKISILMQNNSSIDVKRVFDEMETECHSLNIETPYLLYSLLREHCQEQFSFPRAPHIVQKGMEDEQLSFTSLIENYLLDRGEVVSREDLLFWLTEEIGTSSLKLEMALLESSRIFYYTRGQQGEYIHEDVLGWDDQLKEQLRMLMNAKLDKEYIASVKPFIVIDDCSTTDQLPKLTGSLEWSRDLLLDCLKRDDNFLLLGSKGHVLLKRKNPSFIETNTDFITYVIRKEFGGSAPVADLKRKLREYAYSHTGDFLQDTESLLDSDAAPFRLVDEVYGIGS